MGLWRGLARFGKPAEGLSGLREPVKLTLDLGQCDGRTRAVCGVCAQGLDAQVSLPCDGFFDSGCMGVAADQLSSLVQRPSLEVGVNIGEDELV
jgi:hypothetical protein